VQVLGNVSERIAELHEAGYVHRDLKPSNVVWLPREGRWVLIDFGMTTKIGKKAVIGFTPNYAAPEVLKASLEGKKIMTADSAVDAWALGVIAFELLTGTQAFYSTSQVRPCRCSLLAGSVCLVLKVKEGGSGG
jgi:serine/threonine protein kinase